MKIACFCLFILSAVAGPLHAETRQVSDAAELNRAVAAAKPGDTILVAPGDYANNFSFANVRGAEGRPVVIAAADPKQPPRFAGTSTGLHFRGASHLELRDLAIAGAQGNGLNIDDGGDLRKPSRRITLKNLRVRDIGARGNSDGIKLSGVEDFRVEGCVVERWSSGGSGIDMVGCHRGEIAGCTFRDGGASAVQTKGGSADIAIRRCRFEDAGARGVNLGGSTGDPYFRPPLTDFPADGKHEAKNLLVEGCTFVRGGAPVAFVGVDGAIVRNNTFYRPSKWVIRILQEKTDAGFVPCRRGVFERNIVVFRSGEWSAGGVNIGPKTAPETFTFAGNFWFCEDQPNRSRPQLPTPEKDAIVGQDPKFKDPANGDFSLRPESPAKERGAEGVKTLWPG